VGKGQQPNERRKEIRDNRGDNSSFERAKEGKRHKIYERVGGGGGGGGEV